MQEKPIVFKATIWGMNMKLTTTFIVLIKVEWTCLSVSIAGSNMSVKQLGGLGDVGIVTKKIIEKLRKFQRAHKGKIFDKNLKIN